ncbi:MAG: amidohydrolase family protein [Thermoanaerobaculia bacterium]
MKKCPLSRRQTLEAITAPIVWSLLATIAVGLVALAGVAEAQTEVLREMVASPPPATVTVYTARKILTMERGNPVATAVAVSGKRIVAVGSLAEVRAALGDAKVTVDESFAGKVVMPGFIDQHLHPLLGALTLSTEVIAPEEWQMPARTFKAAATPGEYLARLRAAEAGIRDPKEWLFTWGYHKLWHGPMSRRLLDSVSATRPIMVWQRSCHEFYFNTAAIQALGFTEAGMKGKGAASEMMSWAEGHWWESGTNLVIMPLLKVFGTPARFEFGLRQMVAYAQSRGITAFNEPGALVTPEILQLYHRVLGAEETPLSSFFIVDGRAYTDRGVPPAEAIADGEKVVAANAAGKVSFFPKQIKLFADGAIISQLMQMKDPYLGADGKPDPSHHGEWMMSPQVLEERSKAYWDAGYQLHIHVNGDAGLEVVIATLERRMRENPRADHRSVIVHFANSNEEQIGRIARLGAIVSVNSYYPVGFADKYAAGLGPERADVMTRNASVLKRHIPLSFHSDLPMAPADPLFLAWCAVNRVTPSGRVAGPEQRIGVEDALRAITIEAAYSWRKENDLGSIAPGKIASFTVLEEDPFAVEPMRLKDIPIWGTVYEGRPFPSPATPRRSAAARESAAPAPSLAHGGHGDGGGDACDMARMVAAAFGRNARETGTAAPRGDARP